MSKKGKPKPKVKKLDEGKPTNPPPKPPGGG